MNRVVLPLIFLSFISFASPMSKPNVRPCQPADADCKKDKSHGPVDSDIQKGDILLSVNGIKLTDPKKGLQAFQALNGSKRAVIRVMRNGKEQTIVRKSK